MFFTVTKISTQFRQQFIKYFLKGPGSFIKKH